MQSAKAREKLQEFALTQPESFQLLAIAGLYALGCRRFILTLDADDFVVEADQPIPREPFTDLWSFISRGSGDSTVVGCRLLGIAILTSVRLEEMSWAVQSSDSHGPWEHTLTVRKGELLESQPTAKETAPSGVLLSARRRSPAQVARRYLSRWLGQLQQREHADEQRLRERLFLPKGSTLVINGRTAFSDGPASPHVLAVLETGQAPSLVDCGFVHKLERDYSISVLLCHPNGANDPSLPGRAHHVQWIWNSLRMDTTTLGSDLQNFRAFVWASELRPDLSFTSLVDNRDKQALERTVRSLARELLDRFSRALAEEILAQPAPEEPSAYQDLLSIIKTGITERVTLSRDPARLASLNRALIDCPLVLGSSSDGVRRWISFREIWNELRHGRPVAAFSGPPVGPQRSSAPWVEVPAWPDRPLVLYTDPQERSFLAHELSSFKLLEGERVLAQILRLMPKASGAVAPGGRVEGEPALTPSALTGVAVVDGKKVGWSLSRLALEGFCSSRFAKDSGGLVVRRDDGTGFVDTTLKLPLGLWARVEAEWTASYSGCMSDPALAAQVREALLTSFCEAISSRSVAWVDMEDYALSSMLLEALSEADCGTESWCSLEWLVATAPGGERRRTSPDGLLAERQRLGAPVYVAPWIFTLAGGIPYGWASVPVVLVTEAAEEGLSRLLKRPLQSAGAFSALLSRPLLEWSNDGLVWSGGLAGEEAAELSPDLLSFRLGIPVQKGGRSPKARISTGLKGYQLAEEEVSWSLPGARIAVDWNHGWPDSGATTKLGGSLDADNRVMRMAALRLAQQFFAECSAEQIMEADADLVGTLMFELLSEDSTANLRVLPVAAGVLFNLSEIPAPEGKVTYFTQRSPLQDHKPGEVYLPGPMADAISLLSDLEWVKSGAAKPPTRATRGKATGPASKGGVEGGQPAPDQSAPSQPAPQQGEYAKSAVEPSAPASASASTPAADLPAPAIEIVWPDAPPKRTPQPTPRANKPEDVATEELSAAAPPPLPEVVQQQAQEVPGAAFMPPARDWASLTLAEGVEALLEEFRAIVGPSQYLLGSFYLFLRDVQIDDSKAEALSLREGRPTLGKPCQRALSTPHGRLFLLSALYSVYNREARDADDQSERWLHQSIVLRAQALHEGSESA